jgi:aspartate kinase
LISEGVKIHPFLPSFIVKNDQILISISANDLSFIVEDHLSHIFSLFSQADVSVNVMQNSAVSFTVCVDNDLNKVPALITSLKAIYKVYYNDGLVLYTIRHYDKESVEKVRGGRKILLEQKSRGTIRLVFSSKEN